MPKQINETTLVGDVLHEWTIQEYERHERGVLWYILGITIGLGLVLFAMFTGNFLFALIIILFAVILFLQSHQEPLQIPFKISELGIIVSNRFYAWSEFSFFYIIYEPPHVKTLFLETSSTFRPVLRIPLLDMNPIEIRHTLKEFLKEDVDKEEEPLTDRMARNWRIH
ncbi:MAG: hypothetical protein WC862_00415 [Patescibacteria group bacterium]